MASKNGTKAAATGAKEATPVAGSKPEVATIEAPEASDPVASSYNAIPYQSKPFAQSTPEQIAAMAGLFGLTPPEIRKARVLEIGCSAGGNLIPLAVRYPGLHATGVDISSVEIEQGQAQVKALGLKNCELVCADIAKATDRLADQYDFIICHGVFSWVPDSVRHAIMDVVRTRLAPEGVAYISYNVYPGWKFREVIRDMMLFHAGGLQDAGQRLGQAKAILEYIKGITPEQTAYGRMLRDEAAIVSRVSDDYLQHEHLSHNNSPMYFRDFVTMAAEHKLAYLGEAYLSDMAPQRLGGSVYETLNKLSAGNILATEQYMDFFTNRTFRQTLLVHQAAAGKVNRALGPQSMAGKAFSTGLTVDASFKAVAGQAPLGKFGDAAGRSIAVNAPLPLAMIQVLTEARPYPVAFDDLVRLSRARVPQLEGAPAQAIADAIGTELLNLLLQNMVRVHLDVPQPPASLDRPRAFELARVQAQAGQNWATNVLHVPVGLSPGHQVVLASMDGNRDVAAIEAVVLERLKDGRLTAQQGTNRITDEAALQQLATAFTRQAVGELRNLALLV